MINRILIAVDGSDCADRAASYGFELAEEYGASVDVLHVLETESGPDARDVSERANALLEETAALADSTVAIETHLESGRPAPTVSDFARDHDADLIVMGRRGRTGLGARLLGSTTERVLRRTQVPVLTVAEDDEKIPSDIANVLVTTDGSAEAERAAPVAGNVASEFGATLHVLTIVDVQGEAGLFDAGGVSREYIERLEARGQEAVDRLAESIDADVDLETALERGTPHEAIGSFAAEHDVDLLVIGSEGQSSLPEQRLGSVTTRVLRTVDVPVLVVPVSN
jgi:nucleotide-binding universal stress UspA family protein